MKKYLPLLLALAACEPRPTFLIEDEFTEEEMALIHEAADEWIRAIDSYSAVIFLQDGLHQNGEFDADKHWYGGPDFGLIWKVSNREHGYHQILEKEDSDGFSGLAYDGKRVMIVSETIDGPDDFKEVILHEFGHILGISHISTGLMSEGGNDRPCIDAYTVRHYCKSNDCGPNAGSTCEK